MDEDDSVVEEVDVYLSRTLAENLFIFQYPYRPSETTYDDVTVLDARVKPKQQKFELEFELNVNSSTYDRGKGEQFVVNVNSNYKSEEPYFKGQYMDKLTMVSSDKVDSASRYIVGMFRDGDLHISALKGIVQLHPIFNFLDLSDPRNRSGGQDAKEVDSSMEDGDDDITPVTVKFARRETDRAKQARERSYNFLQKKMSEERWINLGFNSIHSEASRLEINRLQCTQLEEKVPELYMSSSDYLQALISGEEETEFEKPNLPPSASMCAVHLRTLPLGDQIRTLLGNAKVLKFHQLMSLLPTDVDVMSVIRALQQVAVLVQGCWVVKSEILFPKDSFSLNTGVSAEVLCRARDYIMWKFTQSSTITRKEVNSLVKLPQEDIKEMLSGLARVRPIKGWEFILSHDDAFIRRHPEVVQRQQMLWDAKYLQLSKMMKLPKLMTDSKLKSDLSETVMKSPSKPKQRRRTKSSQEADTSEDTDSDVKPNVAKTEFASLECKAEASPPAENVTVKMEPMELENGMLNGLDTEESVDVPVAADFTAELCSFVREKLRMLHSISLSNLKLLLNSKLADSSAAYVLSQGVTTKALEMALQEIGAEHINATWPSGWEQDPIYALGTMNDARDPLRRALLDLFHSGPKHRKALIKKKIEEQTGDHISEKDFLELLKDYCQHWKSGYYLIKGTVSPLT